MKTIIKRLIVVLLLMTTSFALYNCKSKDNDKTNHSEVVDYDDIIIQIDEKDIKTFQYKITEAKNEKLLNENSLYLTTIFDEKTCYLDGFTVKKLNYSETNRIERNYPINSLSVSWVKDNNKDNIEDIELSIVYWPDYDKSYVTNGYIESSIKNTYELQYKNYLLYLLLINDYTLCILKICNSCIDYENVVKILNNISDIIGNQANGINAH